jgi:hypothetical protein
MKRRWIILGFLSFVLAGIVVALFAASRLVSSEAPLARGEAFPLLNGTNLLLEKIRVPDDLSGEFRLLVIAYDSDQQVFVDKWLLPLEELNADYPQLAGYYIPLLPQDTADAAVPIIGGMTLAAKDDRDRARTVVVFTDVDAFNRLVGVPDTSQIQLFLLDSEGAIRWHGSGRYQYETLASLENALADLTAGG